MTAAFRASVALALLVAAGAEARAGTAAAPADEPAIDIPDETWSDTTRLFADAGQITPTLSATTVEPEAPMPPLPTRLPCDEPGSDQQAWIDKVQRGVYTGVCGTAVWFDGLFGNPRYDQDSDQTYGRVALFESYDRRDQFDTRLRLRARYAFPALENRVRVTLGRGEDQELIEDRPKDTENPLPASFRTVDDDAWLLGLGYSKQGGLENGFDFGVGVRLRSPLDPYVKATYRHNFIFNEDTMLRFRETPFWRDSRGSGATTELALDHLLAPTLLFRWNNTGTVAEDTEALEWGTNVSLYQSLSGRRAISYTALLRGETGADVPLRNYGFESRYRRRIYRDWLFLELSGSVTWPREERDEKREINPGAGIGIEMYFGPVPEVEMR